MSAWSDFIASQSLSETADTPLLAHCDHLAVIRAHGEEAGHYLQGQLSCDLRDVDQGAHRQGMHLSLKGRGLVCVRVVKSGDDYLLLCPASQREAVIKALMKYRLRAKVDFQVDDEAVVLGLAGNLQDTGLAVLPAAGESHQGEHALLLRYLHNEQLLLITDSRQAEALWRRLAAHRTVTGANGWLCQDIAAGEGQLFPGAEDLFLPQVLNLDVTGGVSFKKGCYTGQEVVARMHFKGKLKQRMQRIDYRADIPLAAGQVLRDKDGKAAGEVVFSAAAREGHRALVALRRDAEGDWYVDQQPLQASLVSLPYGLPWKE
ncbi:MAG: folate-binding protein [Alcanivorax sp.]|nr:folate-binding protein [Alcanivorax sp.]